MLPLASTSTFSSRSGASCRASESDAGRFARIDAELHDRHVGLRVHRDQHAPGAVIEPAFRIGPTRSVVTSSATRAASRGFPGAGYWTSKSACGNP